MFSCALKKKEKRKERTKDYLCMIKVEKEIYIACIRPDCGEQQDKIMDGNLLCVCEKTSHEFKSCYY